MAEAANQNLKLNPKQNYVSKASLSQLTSTSLQSSSVKNSFLSGFVIIGNLFKARWFFKNSINAWITLEKEVPESTLLLR